MIMRLRRAIGCLALVALLGALFAPATHAQSAPLYFPATGHHLTDDYGFLSFWHAHAGERMLGFPVTEPITVDGLTLQYFERGRLEYHVDQATGASEVRTGRVGAEYAEALWRSFAPPPQRRATAGELLFEATGHTLREPFLGFWQAAGGEAFFGAPISEPLWELTAQGQRRVQYFERARLERDARLSGTPAEIQVSDLGRALALLRGVDITPLANVGFASYGPSVPLAPQIAPLNPVPTAAPAVAAPAIAPAKPAPAPAAPAPRPRAGGEKSIVVNLRDQWLYAYEGKTLVYDAPVSTGRDGMNTPTGTYAIYSKLKVQTMDGVTDGEYWVVPNVPNVMYINGGVALHGTYWHNRFGTGARVSHGCVNLPLDDAAWLYEWAPMGTPVRVTY
jgi:lipoprotein-anchoring transpeptidase ErfK/SrfK